MGMFDHVKCLYPLPSGQEVQNHIFQTKDFECTLSTYTITAEGRLIFHLTRTEEVPEEERPYWGKPEWDALSWIGSVQSVPVADVDMKYHGLVNFYTYTGQPGTDSYKWYEFNAKFTDGQLVEIIQETKQPWGDE